MEFSAYIKTITALTIFTAMASMCLPDNSFRKYLELILGILVMSAVIQPLFSLFQVEDIDFFDWNETYIVSETLLDEGTYEQLELERLQRIQEKLDLETQYTKEGETLAEKW
ncbi:stage III sporulation protein AF [Chakrabartyella piscis]|uniref:stage III sporulation protein AF n=1 Tax=Chakrabartyella piscis TaxID=2918914 RepID=UPI002958B5D0|nr:stage III sporulation protein AF [Chakrabartyella piscis]